jgi:hypothetical protein
MLGPLKFGLQKTSALAAPLTTVKAAVDPGRFELTLSLDQQLVFSPITLKGPAGATAGLSWTIGNGQTRSRSFTIPSGGIVTETDIVLSAVPLTATFTGSNLITEMYIRTNNRIYSITGITGTYPTALKTLQVEFNYADAVFTPPNLERLGFYSLSGPSSLTTGSNLISLDFPSNLTSLYLSASTKLTVLPPLPSGLTELYTPPGLIGLTGVPSTLTSLNLSASTKLTSLPPLPSGLTELYTPSGIVGLTGVVPNLTTLDISRSTKLTTLSIPGAKITSLTVPPTCTTLNVSGCTGLTSLTVPSKVTSLNISKCTGITTVTFPPVLTTLRIDGSGITTLDLSKTNVTTLNMPPSMDTQLKTVAFGSKLKPSGLFRFEIPEDGNWTLY